MKKNFFALMITLNKKKKRFLFVKNILIILSISKTIKYVDIISIIESHNLNWRVENMNNVKKSSMILNDQKVKI